MKDIEQMNDESDLIIRDVATAKAGNVLSVQLGNLEYAPDFGVDYRYFLQSEITFQNQSFKAYLVQRLTQNQINVSDVLETVESLFTQYTYSVSGSTDDTGGLIE